MNLKKNAFLSLLVTIAVTVSSFSVAFARVDEGMFAPGQIKDLNLRKKGLKIKPEEIYDPQGGGLSEAVVRLSIGCTAEFVSPDGLILTNHHCGFDGLVSASTPQNDLVENGFRTDSRAGEIPAKDYSVFITTRVDDVTAKINEGTTGLTGQALAAAIKKNTDALTASEQAKVSKGSTVRIQSLNSGFFHYLYEQKELKDVRIVYAPPRNIGVFGGDPDNFEWTRHTGDFTFLRAYVAPDGSSASYSPANVPFKPRKFLTMNIGGVKENDFVFVMGYPGSTTRYRESWSMQYARDANFPFLEAWLNELSASLNTIGSTDEKKRIAFQSEIANFDNSRKAFGGGYRRLQQSKVLENRREEETRLAAWIAANPARQQKYGTLLSELRSLSEETNAAMKRDVIMRRFPDPNSMTVFPQVMSAVVFTQLQKKTLNDSDRAAKLKEIQDAYKDREPEYEAQMLRFFLRSLADLPEGQKFAAAEKLFGNLKGQARREAEAKFADSIAKGEFANPERVARLYGVRTMERNETRDRILDFAEAVALERQALTGRGSKFNSSIDRLRLLYMQALTEMKGVTAVYPDANSSLRFSYGYIKGYAPREAEFRTPFTTLAGMFEKDTGVKPFDVPQKLKDLDAAKDFGRYGQNGSVVVNFLSSTDIIGGNSGSPILNAKGEQVGLCFDGNYEGLGNDFYYDADKNRTISVDIRYVLFVTEKFGNAKWVVDEMKIVNK
jgi:hypothetical protein